MKYPLRCMQKAGMLSALDLHFALFIADIADVGSDALMLAAALVSQRSHQGDVCLALPDCAGELLFSGDGQRVVAPELTTWRELLRASGVAGQPGDHAPLILDHADRLYTARYWQYEQDVVDYLQAQTVSAAEVDPVRLAVGLKRLFPGDDDQDWQRLAAAIASLKGFVVISGGPGTGKTTTVTKLLALLISQWPAGVPRIALAAPTGKAAARLSESIKGAKAGIDFDTAVLNAIPEQAETLHRLLGILPGRAEARFHAGHPLPADVLVLDEASMVDLPMMARLVRALRPSTRLIMLGDKDQLASVEAGNVLGDICDSGHNHGYSAALCQQLNGLTQAGLRASPGPALQDHIVVLRRSYRFDERSGIGQLARAVNGGEVNVAQALLAQPVYQDIHWRDVPAAQIEPMLASVAAEACRAYLTAETPARALDLFNRFRILCALREGRYGVESANRLVEKALWANGLINARERWYRGRPIMITRNDYNVQLFNGDIGMLWPDPAAGNRLRAFFTTADGRLRSILPQRLPEHETVYAMTIHKSQGSEFDRVLMILPDEAAAVLSRELIYTGITRAKQHVELWGALPVFCHAVAHRTVRVSGLRDALWHRPPVMT